MWNHLHKRFTTIEPLILNFAFFNNPNHMSNTQTMKRATVTMASIHLEVPVVSIQNYSELDQSITRIVLFYALTIKRATITICIRISFQRSATKPHNIFWKSLYPNRTQCSNFLTQQHSFQSSPVWFARKGRKMLDNGHTLRYKEISYILYIDGPFKTLEQNRIPIGFIIPET